MYRLWQRKSGFLQVDIVIRWPGCCLGNRGWAGDESEKKTGLKFYEQKRRRREGGGQS